MLPLRDLVVHADSAAEDVALAIAMDAHPMLRDDEVRRQLDEMARPLKSRVAGSGVEALCRHVWGELGFRGNDDYDDPRNNYLDDVVARRIGSPVTLAVVAMALGRRCGVEVRAIAFPGHFLVRIGDVYADPFDGGHPLPRERLEELATEMIGDVREAGARLEPVGLRTVAVRILANLQRIHRMRGDHARALVVCDRLFDMTRAPLHQADRAAHALALGATRAAISDFEAYLAAHPDAADAEQIRRVIDAAHVMTAPSN